MVQKMETKTQHTSGITRRKTSQYVKLCPKEERNASLKKVSSILQKAEHDRTLEEQQMLGQCSEVVADLKMRWQRRDEAKRRLEEVEESMDVLEEKCQVLAKVLAQSEHLVVYTGAGISTAARIPDYRGTNGIWTRLQQGKDIGNHDLSLAEPTFTHMALSQLYHRKTLKYVVSQNCDGLHLRSGLPRSALSELHGNMYIEVCKNCKPAREYWRLFDVTENTARYSHKTMRRCYICNHELIDTIVHFGERGTLQWPLNWSGACKNADKADTILCLGSSLKVLKRYPWLWQMNKPAKKRPNLYIVNLQWTPKDDYAVLKINGKCDAVMRMVMKYLDINVPKYDREKDPIFSHATNLCEAELHTTTQPMLKFEVKEEEEMNTQVEDKHEIAEMKCEIKTEPEKVENKAEDDSAIVKPNIVTDPTSEETKVNCETKLESDLEMKIENPKCIILEQSTSAVVKSEPETQIKSDREDEDSLNTSNQSLIKEVKCESDVKINPKSNFKAVDVESVLDLTQKPQTLSNDPQCNLYSNNDSVKQEGNKTIASNKFECNKSNTVNSCQDLVMQSEVTNSIQSPVQEHAYDFTITKHCNTRVCSSTSSTSQSVLSTTVNNSTCDTTRNNHTSIKTARLSAPVTGTNISCTLSENSNFFPRRKSLCNSPPKASSLFSIDSILHKNDTPVVVPNNAIGQNIQTIMAYYEIANTVLQNQMLSYLSTGFYPYQTSFMYPGIHSIINPVPYFNYDFNCASINPPVMKDIDSQKLVELENKSNPIQIVPTCNFCDDVFNSVSCLYYKQIESTFIKQLFRFSKTTNCNKSLVCVCCDYTTDEECESDSENKTDKVKKKLKRNVKIEGEIGEGNKLDDTESASENIDETNICENSSKNENIDTKVETKVKVQPGWFGKGCRKNRRPKKR